MTDIFFSGTSGQWTDIVNKASARTWPNPVVHYGGRCSSGYAKKTINKKLESLTNELLSEEKENLDISSTIDIIQGLLIDIYK